MNVSPLVTVAMSVYNASETVDLAIRSILAQTYPNWELIVVDDGSTDRTADRVLRVKDPRVRFVQEPLGNRGLASRLNQCVRLAKGRYIARMDADDVAYPRRLERQVQFLETHRDVDVLGTGAAIFKGAGEIIGCYPTACSHEAICRKPWWGFPLAHPTWMGRRAWFLSHPYSDQDGRCEDQALLLRSFSHSRFAAMEDVLLGYRMDGIAARKLGKGRLNYCRRLLARVKDLPSLRWAMMGVGVHGAAMVRDALLQACGIVGNGSRRSWRSAGQAERAEWQAVWAGLTHDPTALTQV
jgi:glycosyltransferase involved in cell wall biosynthesis